MNLIRPNTTASGISISLPSVFLQPMFWSKPGTTPSVEKGPTATAGTASSGVSRGQLSGLINQYKTESDDGAFLSFLSEFKGLLNLRDIASLIGVTMSFCSLFYQSACVLSIWCWACWLFSYYLSTQFLHKTELHVAAKAELTINVLDNGDAVPCPFLWSSSVKLAPTLLLLDWLVHCSCLRAFLLDRQTFASFVVLYVPT